MSKIDITYTHESAYGNKITYMITVSGKEEAERVCRKIEFTPGYRIKDVSAHWDEYKTWLNDEEYT